MRIVSPLLLNRRGRPAASETGKPREFAETVACAAAERPRRAAVHDHHVAPGFWTGAEDQVRVEFDKEETKGNVRHNN